MASLLTFRNYMLISTISFISVFLHSFYKYEDFYPLIQHISTAKFTIAIIYNFIFMCFLSTGRIFLIIFVGQLRDLEVEQLIDNGRGFLMDTILFLVLSNPTVDGSEVSTVSMMKFICFVVALKTFHLVLQIRVTHLFEVGIPRSSVMLRLASLMFLLIFLDFCAVLYFYRRSSRTSTLYLWLLFECLGMMASCTVSVFKFAINLIDIRMENGWSSKSAIIFYLDLLNDVLSLGIFLVFMLIFFFNHPSRLPLYMTADIIQVVRTLYQRLRSFQKYRKLTKNMEETFIDATLEELDEADTCIICRDFLYKGSKKLPCSHIFHLDCLKSWLVQQQSCPTCRSEIVAENFNSNQNAQNVESADEERDTGVQETERITEMANDENFKQNFGEDHFNSKRELLSNSSVTSSFSSSSSSASSSSSSASSSSSSASSSSSSASSSSSSASASSSSSDSSSSSSASASASASSSSFFPSFSFLKRKAVGKETKNYKNNYDDIFLRNKIEKNKEEKSKKKKFPFNSRSSKEINKEAVLCNFGEENKQIKNDETFYSKNKKFKQKFKIDNQIKSVEEVEIQNNKFITLLQNMQFAYFMCESYYKQSSFWINEINKMKSKLIDEKDWQNIPYNFLNGTGSSFTAHSFSSPYVDHTAVGNNNNNNAASSFLIAPEFFNSSFSSMHSNSCASFSFPTLQPSISFNYFPFGSYTSLSSSYNSSSSPPSLFPYFSSFLFHNQNTSVSHFSSNAASNFPADASSVSLCSSSIPINKTTDDMLLTEQNNELIRIRKEQAERWKSARSEN